MTAEPAAPWSSTLYSVVMHPTEPLILAMEDGGGWTLPRLDVPERVWPRHAEGIGPLLAHAVGMQATILRCADTHEETDAAHVALTYVLESHGPPLAPRGLRWLGHGECACLHLPLQGQHAIVEECMAEAEGAPVPTQRPPWQRRGWFTMAERWIAGALAERGTPLRRPLEQIKVSGAACILRAPQDSGVAYFKQSAPVALAADEPRLMTALATHYPGRVPAPLAHDPEHGWMLLPDLGATAARADETVWTDWLETFGSLQRASARQVPALLASGCPDRRLDVLRAGIAPLLDDALALGNLEESEVTQLHGLRPHMEQMCGALAALGVPPALAHGDLHPGNVAGTPRHYLFFDWATAAVAHPFFDLESIRYEATAALGPGAWERLLERYLALWESYESPAGLRAAWALAEPLGLLHKAITYQHLFAALEPAARGEIDGMVSGLLRDLLQAL